MTCYHKIPCCQYVFNFPQDAFKRNNIPPFPCPKCGGIVDNTQVIDMVQLADCISLISISQDGMRTVAEFFAK